MRCASRVLYRVLPVLAPTVLGLLIGLLMERGILPNLLLMGTYEVDLAALLSRGGVLVTLVIAAALVLRRRIIHSIEQQVIGVRQAESEARRRFFRRLDHEMKNPLQISRLGVANLQLSPTLTADEEATLLRMGQQTQRLQKLVADLRWLTELEERGFESRPVVLEEVLQEAIGIAAGGPEYALRDITLTVQQVPWPLSRAWGDRDLLVLVFRNLLDNALKYSGPDDRIEVRATDDGQHLVVEVADTGAGIPADDMPHIFEELYRSDQSRGIAGSGLGLSLVERIVRLHGGTVEARSRLGRGTVMVVRLPSAPEGF